MKVPEVTKRVELSIEGQTQEFVDYALEGEKKGVVKIVGRSQETSTVGTPAEMNSTPSAPNFDLPTSNVASLGGGTAVQSRGVPMNTPTALRNRETSIRAALDGYSRVLSWAEALAARARVLSTRHEIGTGDMKALKNAVADLQHRLVFASKKFLDVFLPTSEIPTPFEQKIFSEYAAIDRACVDEISGVHAHIWQMQRRFTTGGIARHPPPRG